MTNMAINIDRSRLIEKLTKINSNFKGPRMVVLEYHTDLSWELKHGDLNAEVSPDPWSYSGLGWVPGMGEWICSKDLADDLIEQVRTDTLDL